MTTADPFVLKENGATLLTLAADAVTHAVSKGETLAIEPASYPKPLQLNGASFVTLKKDGMLRGCIGSLQAKQPLVVNVADNAHGAVARDTRFPTVAEDELEDLEVSVSVLSPLSKIEFESEDNLMAQLRPGTDGLVIAEEGRRSTFLPQVWEDLSESKDFLKNLKRKGGFDPGPLSESVKAWRYQVADVGPVAVIHN